jgi:hypothetical protein
VRPYSKNKERSVHSHFLHGGQEMFLFFPISPHSYPVTLNSFPNKLHYYFYYRKKKEGWQLGSLEHLPSKHKALSSNPNNIKKTKQNKKPKTNNPTRTLKNQPRNTVE